MRRGEGLKRTGPLARVTPLLARTRLSRGDSELTRSAPLPRPPATPAAGGATPQQKRRKAQLATWPKVRDLVLKRDENACVRCGRSDQALEVHHRRHRSQGGADVLSNLVALCGWGNHTGCHGFAHGPHSHSEGVAVGLTVPWGSEPHELAVLYADGVRYYLDDDGDRVAA